MGDRGNIIIKADKECFKHQVVFYTHWSGSDLPHIVRNALIRGRDRWNDSPYLARIIFSELIKDSIEELAGFGISTEIGDGEDQIVNVFMKERKVTFHKTFELPSMTFEELVSTELSGWRNSDDTDE